MKPILRWTAIGLNLLFAANMLSNFLNPPDYTVGALTVFLVFAAPISALSFMFIYGK
jgi:hypothetical protein